MPTTMEKNLSIPQVRICNSNFNVYIFKDMADVYMYHTTKPRESGCKPEPAIGGERGVSSLYRYNFEIPEPLILR